MAWVRDPYFYGHWKACLCDRCEPVFRRHNENVECGCDFCVPRHAEIFKNDVNNARARAGLMATVNICDRCESVVTSEAAGSISWIVSPKAERKGWVLCPECIADFVRLFVNGEYQPREGKAYRKAYEEEKHEENSTEQLLRLLLEKLDGPKAIEGQVIDD